MRTQIIKEDPQNHYADQTKNESANQSFLEAGKNLEKISICLHSQYSDDPAGGIINRGKSALKIIIANLIKMRVGLGSGQSLGYGRQIQVQKHFGGDIRS